MENKVNIKYFEFLAENETYKKLLSSSEQNNWLNQTYFLKGNITNDKNSLRDTRNYFLKTIASENGNAKILSCKGYEDLKEAGLTSLPNIENLTDYSAIISLEFELLSPLLTHDDNSFYLFDNPVKKDHIFKVPYLAAASMKGLTFDAFLRAFPNNEIFNGDDKISKSDKVCKYRRQEELYANAARRLFGVADNAETNLPNDNPSQIGRLHFAPIWFKYIQYLVMNPSSEKNSMPIQFEAIAAKDSDKKTVKATIDFWYINKIDGKESSELEVKADLSLLLAAMAEWLPALGLGAKRLAGYGAIKPSKATFKGKSFKGELSKPIIIEKNETSWKILANKLKANI